MRPFIVWLSLGIPACALLVPRAGISQASSPPQQTGRAPIEVVEALRMRGIESSLPALISALKNDDRQIRSLAAVQLAAYRDVQAIPAMEQALSVEKDLRVRSNIASSLWNLGDPVGLKHLEAMCTDATLPTSAIAAAERKLAEAKYLRSEPSSTGKCADLLLAVFNRPSDHDDWDQILTQLPTMYHDVPRDQADRMIAYAQNLLSDGTPAVRMSASQALAEMGSVSSIPLLRTAVEREDIPSVQTVLQHYLEVLQKQLATP